MQLDISIMVSLKDWALFSVFIVHYATKAYMHIPIL
jgi:hypothetical protein